MARGKTKKNKDLFANGLKYCPFCQENKVIDDFYKNSSTTDKLSCYCKKCSVKRNFLQYQKSKTVCLCKVCKMPLKHKTSRKNFCQTCYQLYKKEYRKNYEHKKRTNISYKIKDNFSRRIRASLKHSKNHLSVKNYLSYLFEDLKQHLEQQFDPWMNWNNWGKYNAKTWNDDDPSTWAWQIDHIIPHSFFHYNSMEDEDFKKCWALDNLRPYSAKQNIKEGNRRSNF